MANTKVFSWKINDYKYGYLYVPGKSGSELISNRIIDENVLNQIAQVVSGWNEREYEQKFNELNEIIHNAYQVYIPGEYKDYFSQGVDNYIVLTGKDGSAGKASADLSQETFNKIKNFVSASVAQAKKELKAEVESVKDYTIGKMTEEVSNVNDKITTAQAEIASNNSALSSQLSSAQAALNTAAQLFDFESAGVTKQNLINAIKDSKTAKVNFETNNALLSRQSQLLDRHDAKIEDIRVASESLNRELTTLSERTTSRLDAIESNVSEISNTVETIKVISNAGSQESGESQVFSKGIVKEEESEFIGITDNDDGTSNLDIDAGGEKYSIKVYGYGKKLKVREIDDGLAIASNGFRYKDSSGSIISLINGNILLSNADGSGKLEIKKDGLYINGTKQ